VTLAATGRTHPAGVVDGDSYRVETLADRREAFGHDEQSTIADPRFLAPENDDYRLRYDSPARKRGFQPVDHAAVGLLADHPFADPEPVARAFPRVAGVDGTPSYVELAVGGTVELSVTARTETGYVVAAADATTRFESDDRDVATVDDGSQARSFNSAAASASVVSGAGSSDSYS
jgi:hypothetical protein